MSDYAQGLRTLPRPMATPDYARGLRTLPAICPCCDRPIGNWPTISGSGSPTASAVTGSPSIRTFYASL